MTESINFIEGCFTPAEAADALLSLLNDKIKFHTVKSLHLREEESAHDSSSTERIHKLKEAKKLVEQLVVKAHKNGFQLEIESSIKIKLID